VTSLDYSSCLSPVQFRAVPAELGKPDERCDASITSKLRVYGLLSFFTTSFLHQCTLFGSFWHHLVTSWFPWQLMMGHLDLPIGCLFYSWCSLASLATQTHCYNVTWTRLTARSRSLLDSSSSLLAYCFVCLSWFTTRLIVGSSLLWVVARFILFCRNLLCYIRASRTSARTPCPKILFPCCHANDSLFSTRTHV
jgi:hypothetical protein